METMTATKSKSLYFEHRTKEGQKRYFVYRDRLIKSGIVSPLSVQIWERFADILRQRSRFSNKNISFPSVSKLSDHFKKSVPTITKAINELIDQELITREIGKGGRGNYEKTSEYQLLNHPCFHGDFTKKTIIKGKKLLYPLWAGKGKRNFTKEYKDLLERVKRSFKKGKKSLYGFIDGNVIQLSETTDGFHDVENPECCFSIALVKNRKERKPSPSFSENPKDLKGEAPLKNPPVEEDTNERIKSGREEQESILDGDLTPAKTKLPTQQNFDGADIPDSPTPEKPKPKGKTKPRDDSKDPLKDRPKEIPSQCPKCGKPIVEKLGKNGKFWTCSGWPKCSYKPKSDKAPRHIQAIKNADWYPDWKDQLPDD